MIIIYTARLLNFVLLDEISLGHWIVRIIEEFRIQNKFCSRLPYDAIIVTYNVIIQVNWNFMPSI